MTDKPDPLDEDVFSYRVTKDQKVLISWHNKLVTTAKGPKAHKFLRQIEGEDHRGEQRVMARFTGNFKRGNERNPPVR